MCNCLDCVERIEAEMVDRYKEQVPKLGAKFALKKGGIKELQFFSPDKKTWIARTCSTFEVTCVGRKKTVRIPITHSFCPFCGEQYPRIQNDETAPHHQ